MAFRVILLEQAEADIEANARWWAMHHSVDQAARWLDAIRQQLKSLEQNDDEFSHGQPPPARDRSTDAAGGSIAGWELLVCGLPRTRRLRLRGRQGAAVAGGASAAAGRSGPERTARGTTIQANET